MKKMLILGTSFATLEIVRKARQRGWHTIVTDNVLLEDSPVKQAADAYWMISTADVEKLEEKCREEKIGAIFAGVSEFNLDRVLFLTKKLGLPCYIDEGAWKYARNKQLFKAKCIEKGIPVVNEYQIPDPDDEAAWEQIVYPVVIKPVDGTGNLGVSICHSRQELEEGLRKARKSTVNPRLILERYITGEETWNYYCIASGTVQYIYSGSAFRQPGYPTFLYSFATGAVAGVDDYLAKMNPKCTELLSEIGCRDGIAWIQCIRDETGNYYALEMGHRLSADASGDMLKKSMQFDSIEWMLDTAIGVKHTADMLPKPIARPYAGVQCVYYMFADHAGKIEKIAGLDQLDPDIFQAMAIKKNGDTIVQYRVLVRNVFFARTAREMCDMLQYLNQTISITDTEGKDLIIRFTDYDAVRERHRGLMRDE